MREHNLYVDRIYVTHMHLNGTVIMRRTFIYFTSELINSHTENNRIIYIGNNIVLM